MPKRNEPSCPLHAIDIEQAEKIFDNPHHVTLFETILFEGFERPKDLREVYHFVNDELMRSHRSKRLGAISSGNRMFTAEKFFGRRMLKLKQG
jgi:protein involved in ribonucleotide reduction